MAVKRPRPRDLASIGLLASLGCYLLLASPRDALPDGTSQRRALVASAPPSSDIIQDEYIVTIKPFAYAYDRAVGSCSASPSGTFYGVFQNLDECEDITINIISDHYPDEISWVLHDDTTDTMISTATDLTESFCLKSGAYTFTIHDSYGDGLCCEYGVGSYTVTGSILGTIASGGEYGHEESTSFNVDTGPPPNLCIRIDYDGASSGQIRSTNSEIGVCGISSGYAWDEAPLSLGSFQTQSQVNQYTFTDGTQCGATLRTTTVVVEKGDTGQSSYTIATTQPEVCVYRIVLTLPYCTPDYSEYETTYFGDSQAANLLSTHGGSLIQTFRHTVHGFAATLTSAAKSSLLEDPSVERIEESFKVTSRGFREEEETKRNLRIPYFNLSVDRGNWGMGRICKRGWAAGKYVYIHDAQDIDVYILDTGINESHSDFTGRIGNGKVCIGSAAPATHGTHIASLAAGTKYGPAKRAIMHPVQVLDAQGEGSSSSVLCGMEWVLEQQLAYNALNVGTLKSVANVAFGTNGKTDTLDEAIASMVNSGITTIIAAGNYGGTMRAGLHIYIYIYIIYIPSMYLNNLAFLAFLAHEIQYR